MSKRKSNNDAPLPYIKAKLYHTVICEGQISDTNTSHSPRSTLLSLTSPKRREKRKRTQNSPSDLDDHLEIKRARRILSKSPNPSLEPRPSRHNPCEEETNLMEEEPNLTEEELYIRSCKNAMLFFEKCNESGSESTDCQNPLPSPSPSDGEASESDGWEFPTVDSTHARQSGPKISRSISHKRPRKRDTTSLRSERRQPPKKNIYENKRNSRGRALPPDIEAFLHSKRSSRRNTNCMLCQLGGDGMACTISRVR